MKIATLMGLFLIPVLWLAGQESWGRPRWVMHEARLQWYSAEFPGTPRIGSYYLKGRAGEYFANGAVADRRGARYMVSYIDVPASTIRASADASLARLSEATAPSGTSECLGDTRLEGGHPARHYLIGAAGGVHVRRMTCLVHNRLFHVQVLGTIDQVYAADAGRFLRSFRVLDPRHWGEDDVSPTAHFCCRRLATVE